jgi:SPP1 gp7 family putative phage head morphogenesis protein
LGVAKKFTPPKNIEKKYGASLRRVAKNVGDIVEPHIVNGRIQDPDKMKASLAAYSSLLGPWAEKVAADMLRGVSLRLRSDFIAASKSVGLELRNLISDSGIGQVARQLQERQVQLIRSLPLEAGIRAQKISMDAVITGMRAEESAAKLLETEAVTAARATLIARTETAKATSAITQARAQSIGSDTYIWRTAADGDVRESHAEMEGTVCNFSSPPTLSDGESHNPGEIYNCRCYAEVIFGSGR